MDNRLAELCDSLEALSKEVRVATDNNMPLREWYGWNFPALNRDDLADIPLILAKKLREIGETELDDDILDKLVTMPSRLKLLYSETVPYMFNGNGDKAVPAFLGTLDGITKLVDPFFSWHRANENDLLPPQLAKKLKSFNLILDKLSPDQEKLASQLISIQNATDAALSLPSDLDALQEARNEIIKISKKCDEMQSQIQLHLTSTSKLAEEIDAAEVRAKAVVSQCEEAFHVTTNKGLAGAFDQRATNLTNSMWIWVVWFVTALVAGGYIGANRVDVLSKALASTSLNWGVVVIELFISALSLGGPIWFSWVATKQINQRFRLAEDYAFKASVAKAYEGYRKEASRIDPQFEARLFSSALNRLEEAPLRFVENENHGSPWHELMESSVIKSAVASVPNFKDDVVDFAKKALGDKRSQNVSIKDVVE